MSERNGNDVVVKIRAERARSSKQVQRNCNTSGSKKDTYLDIVPKACKEAKLKAFVTVDSIGMQRA